jgi:hypothetical protein
MLRLARDGGLRVERLETYSHVPGLAAVLARLAPRITEAEAAGILDRVDRALNRLPVARHLGDHWLLVATPEAANAPGASYNERS